jgi:tetratricopeptide (TPR) repeat protein
VKAAKMDDDKIALRKKLARIEELSRWTHELWKTLPLADAIAAIEQRRHEADDDDNRTLTLDLRHFLSLAGREDEADRILDEMMKRMPDDVLLALSKASLHFYDMDNPETALEAVNAALIRAYRTGFFRREALGVKARILLKLGRGDQLSRTLEEIMSLEMTQGIPDIMRERDFVDRAPAGMIAEDVLARYNAFCPKRDGE